MKRRTIKMEENVKEGWKKGIYCDKCKKLIKTNSWIKLWLWSFWHSIKCFHLYGLSPSSFLRINPEYEIIIDGKVKWVE